MEFIATPKGVTMNDTIQADFIIEDEENENEDRSAHLTGWEEIVFDLEDDDEMPW